jgi:hypothetical protein
VQRTGVAPNRHLRLDADLAVAVRGTHGFHAYCACGWEGEVRKAWSDAALDARKHRGWHRMQERGL